MAPEAIITVIMTHTQSTPGILAVIDVRWIIAVSAGQ